LVSRGIGSGSWLLAQPAISRRSNSKTTRIESSLLALRRRSILKWAFAAGTPARELSQVRRARGRVAMPPPGAEDPP
jgi:hypothetical protein